MGDGESGALMVCGATSNAGKSTVAAALCRSWARSGRSVAPFKAQNMSNHAAVTADGGEVGRAQAMQARAAGVELERRMNPILLKPSSSIGSHLVVLGEEVSQTDAVSYGPATTELKPVVFDALQSLRADHDWVIAEGAGGAAEINLLDRDLVNLPLARAGGIPALLVVDIDQGGAFAAAHGTIDLLPPSLRACVAGIVFNKFRGDVSLLADGIAQLEQLDGVPVLGVLPYLDGHVALGSEDSLDVHLGVQAPARSSRPVRVAAIRLPRLSNPSDLDPFLIEPDVELRWVTRPDELASADMIVIPGSRATVADLAWLRDNGFETALREADASIIGVCAGYQMLGQLIHDEVESGAGTVPGLGLLDVVTTFAEPKVVKQSTGSAAVEAVAGYQIRYGRPQASETSWMMLDGHDEGAISKTGLVRGTSLHGLFDADGFRTELLTTVASQRGRSYEPSTSGFESELDAYHDHLADWVEAHVDIARVEAIGAAAERPERAPGW